MLCSAAFIDFRLFGDFEAIKAMIREREREISKRNFKSVHPPPPHDQHKHDRTQWAMVKRWKSKRMKIFCWLESPSLTLNVSLHIRQWDKCTTTTKMIRVFFLCVYLLILQFSGFQFVFHFPSDGCSAAASESQVNYQTHIFQLLNLASFTHCQLKIFTFLLSLLSPYTLLCSWMFVVFWSKIKFHSNFNRTSREETNQAAAEDFITLTTNAAAADLSWL